MIKANDLANQDTEVNSVMGRYRDCSKERMTFNICEQFSNFQVMNS